MAEVFLLPIGLYSWETGRTQAASTITGTEERVYTGPPKSTDEFRGLGGAAFDLIGLDAKGDETTCLVELLGYRKDEDTPIVLKRFPRLGGASLSAAANAVVVPAYLPALPGRIAARVKIGTTTGSPSQNEAVTIGLRMVPGISGSGQFIEYYPRVTLGAARAAMTPPIYVGHLAEWTLHVITEPTTANASIDVESAPAQDVWSTTLGAAFTRTAAIGATAVNQGNVARLKPVDGNNFPDYDHQWIRPYGAGNNSVVRLMLTGSYRR